MQRRLTTQDITWFLDLNGVNRLDLDPDYQRRSVWTRRDRQYFLDTIFNNFPSPPIFLHKETDGAGRATYHVVDGKQRLETILMFVSNKLKMPDDFGDARLDGKFWKDLDDFSDLKKRLWDYQFTVEMLDSIEPSVVNDVFGRLNQNSRKLMPQEIRHSRHDGWFVTFSEAEAERALWRTLRVSTAARARRMQDVQFISELMLVLLEGDITGFSQDTLNRAYVTYDDIASLEPPVDVEVLKSRFDSLSAFLLVAEEEFSVVSESASNNAHLYTLWAWLAQQDSLPDLNRFAAAYPAFIGQTRTVSEVGAEAEIEALSNAEKYAQNVRGASTDLGPRRARLDALTAAMKEALDLL